MGYVESVAFFCATTKTVNYRTLDALSTHHNTPPHRLKDLADTKTPQTSVEDTEATLEAGSNWESLSPQAWVTALAYVEVYLYEFISIVQGVPTERRQMTRHLFCAIDNLFQLNDKDNTAREEPISLKKLCKGDAAWSMQKVVLGWAIDTVKQVLTLLDDRNRNFLSLLNTTPPQRQRILPAALAQPTRHPM